MNLLKKSPCKDCTERVTACWDKCPKDARGEYGHKAWKADLKKQQDAEKEYKRRRNEDYLHSEEREAARQKYGKHKNKLKDGYIYGR